MTKSAIHIGAGNMGRGFIGPLLSKNGYNVIFLDSDQALVDKINKEQSYTVEMVGDKPETIQIDNVSAITSKQVESNSGAYDGVVNGVSVITTSVGIEVVPYLAKTVAKIIKIRSKHNIETHLNIISCEETIRATSLLKQKTMGVLDREYHDYARQYVRFIDSVADRLAPIQPHEATENLHVIIESFFELYLDRKQMPETIDDFEGIVFVDNLDAYAARKNFTLDIARYAIAYMGLLKGHSTLIDAIKSSSVESFAKSVMQDTRNVLIQEFQLSPLELDRYHEKIMERFHNPYISTDLLRIGRQPLNKLEPEEKILKPLERAIHHELPYDALAQLVAIVMHYKNTNDSQAIAMQTKIKESGVANYIKSLINKLDLDSETETQICKKIYDYYHKYL